MSRKRIPRVSRKPKSHLGEANLSLRPRSLDSGRWGGGQSSLIKTDTFTYQNHDLDAIGSEGSFACLWLGLPMGSRKPKSRHRGVGQALL